MGVRDQFGEGRHAKAEGAFKGTKTVFKKEKIRPRRGTKWPSQGRSAKNKGGGGVKKKHFLPASGGGRKAKEAGFGVIKGGKIKLTKVKKAGDEI